MKIGVMVDFDGTISATDASYAILDRFADGDWLSIEKRAYDHEISILDALKLQTGMIRCSPEEAEKYLIETIELRPGFREFAGFCEQSGIPLEICSDGFGWSIEVLLRHWDLDRIPWTSNHTVPDSEGWKIEFRHRRENCPINANCKCSHLWKMRERVDKVIFIGDGTTDECVSREADIVFARDKLLELCKQNGIDCIPWTRWEEVLGYLRSFIFSWGTELKQGA
ncbi:MAG: MtnX-like HAD-IB family phosphatase [Candidatus Thermoplasmatota archaeon]|nr:MtnX-like HAD-IB family phosphatase [Candidatus Thermoplasmatota archaeon]